MRPYYAPCGTAPGPTAAAPPALNRTHSGTATPCRRPLLPWPPLFLPQNMNKRVRCPCGRAICLGNHNYTTSATAQAAQPQVAEEPAYADPDCVSTDLVSRHKVGHRPFSNVLQCRSA